MGTWSPGNVTTECMAYIVMWGVSDYACYD